MVLLQLLFFFPCEFSGVQRSDFLQGIEASKFTLVNVQASSRQSREGNR
jgi:hypothetical protein